MQKVQQSNQEKPKNKPKKKKQIQNDYGQHFVDHGLRPANYIRDVLESKRFIDYPKLNELIDRKNTLLKKRNTPPMFLKKNLKEFDLASLGKFDVILMDPPWEEYYKRIENLDGYVKEEEKEKFKPWTLSEIAALPLKQISETPTFLFLWCGCDHLLDGRTLFNTWGFKRCEDIVWIKTNKENKTQTKNTSETSIFQKVTEHCLVGLSGDVRRASDSFFIHANIDVDIIVSEEPIFGSRKKPEEIYRIIERFCLGRKRLELFGDNQNVRDGWVTVGEHIGDTNWDKKLYESWFDGQVNMEHYKGGRVVGTTQEVETLRPKSPGRKNKQQQVPLPQMMVPQQPYPFVNIMHVPMQPNLQPNIQQGLQQPINQIPFQQPLQQPQPQMQPQMQQQMQPQMQQQMQPQMQQPPMQQQLQQNMNLPPQNMHPQMRIQMPPQQQIAPNQPQQGNFKQ